MKEKQDTILHAEDPSRRSFLIGAAGLAGTVAFSGLPIKGLASTNPGAEAVARPTGKENSTFKITTIGTGSPLINPERAGSGVLLEVDGEFILVDCGYGTAVNLHKAKTPLNKITNMLFTHQHSDHNADYDVFAIRSWVGGRQELNLIGPPGTQLLHENLCSTYKKDFDYRNGLFKNGSQGIVEGVRIQEIQDRSQFEISGVKVSTAQVPHTIHTLAYRFEANGKSIAISGDLTYSENFTKLAEGADIAIMDAVTAPSNWIDQRSEGFLREFYQSHAPIAVMARMCADAQVKKMVLTHFQTDLRKEETLEIVQKIYKGEVAFADDLNEYHL